jgi:hypothetical protein
MRVVRGFIVRLPSAPAKLIAGDKQSTAYTAGEALDALTAQMT